MYKTLLLAGAVAATFIACSNGPVDTTAKLGDTTSTLLSTGQRITPGAAPGATLVALNPGLKDLPDFVAGQPVSEALSPDRKTLLVLTSGYNNVLDAQGKLIKADSGEYVFVFDVSGGAPVKKQVLQVPDTYVGIVFAPDGQHFYVTGGGDDDLHVFALTQGAWGEVGAPIALHHKGGNGIGSSPLATGVDVTADGQRAVVANRYHDSVTLVDLAGGAVIAERDLRPGKSDGASGAPGGEYPNAVRIVGNHTAYVSSERDREIVAVDISTNAPRVAARIPVKGNPNKMVLNRAQTRLFVASDNADIVSVIDTAANRVVSSVSTVAPAGLITEMQYRGASPNGLALSADEQTLYVTNRGTNDVAVVSLAGDTPTVTGLIPTGWYPSDVAAGPGNALYVVYTKNMPGPNGGNCLGYGATPCPVKHTPVAQVQNQYIAQLSKGGFMWMPALDRAALDRLTKQVADNNSFNAALTAADIATMSALRQKIRHVIYIVKENRTYDQILGDLGRGNGDPSLAEFPDATTPNMHALAKTFVTLDNFHDSGDVSGNGWPWTTGARESDAGAKMLPVNYANSPVRSTSPTSRGGSYDWEGANRNVNVGLSGARRQAANPALPADPDLLPGNADVSAPDGPSDAVQQGYIWNAALRAGLTVRNYGFFIDLTRYIGSNAIPRDRTPFVDHVLQAYATSPALIDRTDPFFRGYDNGYPDLYRELEWEREFKGFVGNGQMPALTLLRLPHDHTGAYAAAIDGVNTPELQLADNDYAVGRVAQAVANSPYAANTLIFVVEDDAQDGPDHVDAHRSTAFVIGPYVKQGSVVSTHYTTVNMIRTITEVLGLDHLGLFDATQGPMTDAFDLNKSTWTYKAVASGLLANTQLPIPAGDIKTAALRPTHGMRYWASVTRGMDFSVEDRVDAVAYNKVLWKGLMGAKAYPVRPGEAQTERKRDDDDDDAPVAAKRGMKG
ncbi:bifunctional YncE family protein/alkaline phosphatase family protein [Trinickia terrae]|uniref:Bifunctional YncE family protein/alkaline phosphatase family protein n=1 Tax=Trinickia terrae TaxID=2571161 RepID=A0A4U1HK96_9BURK|nr:bifunctional YncE family protein/alkaline phosphatase family protein [Trinickia terrae]TKC81621.1 bifunctional YncE family protein/alkaline phosphatase family protein [Trinickia terrae]